MHHGLVTCQYDVLWLSSGMGEMEHVSFCWIISSWYYGCQDTSYIRNRTLFERVWLLCLPGSKDFFMVVVAEKGHKNDTSRGKAEYLAIFDNNGNTKGQWNASARRKEVSRTVCCSQVCSDSQTIFAEEESFVTFITKVFLCYAYLWGTAQLSPGDIKAPE